MADINSPLVRLVPPAELPVRIPDWPEAVGIAICRAGGRTISLQPYHLREAAPALKRRLVAEAGDALRGFAVHPAVKGLIDAKLPPAEDLRLISELEQALRSMPRLVEEASDFAINFEFASEEGLGLDGLNDQTRRRREDQGAKPTDQLPVGYHAFVKAEPDCEVISGAMLRPVGAAGVDLLLVPEKSLPLRFIPADAPVLVREDSLRVAIPLGPVLDAGRLPPALRLPAGALLLGATGGKPVPALVLRRRGYLFVAPDYAAIANPVSAAPATPARVALPWKTISLLLAGLALIAGVAVAGWFLLPATTEARGPTAPVQDLRENLFAPRTGG